MLPRQSVIALLLTVIGGGALLPAQAWADDAVDEQPWNLHGQFTYVNQRHGEFTSPYQGQNSLDAAAAHAETTDATLFAGLRLWQGAEAYFDEELDQGFGLSNTLGAAGFPSGEAYKVGRGRRYFRTPRLFLRQTFSFGAPTQKTESAANQLAGRSAADNVVLTVGKFSVVDVFDTNTYAHDPRADFLNWSIIDAGAFDYAADAWGYTYGASVEWTQDWWTLRAGAFNLSKVPNSTELETDFSQFQAVAEFEARSSTLGRPGKFKLLGFMNRANMGGYADAVRLAQSTGDAPATTLVRQRASRGGIAANIEQELAEDIGVFARLSANDGSKEAYDFTEINRSVSFGASIKGQRWRRADDTVGVAVALNGLSSQARSYFAAGGMGILIGDGQLNYASERVLEIYYALHPIDHLTLTADFQHLENPAYNQDRGPVNLAALRVHAEF